MCHKLQPPSLSLSLSLLLSPSAILDCRGMAGLSRDLGLGRPDLCARGA